ncbi:Svf1-like-domain-containing protein [Favolaschia claudopus]|uniref:Svf1-like-domain-containing protein n=1 Tax=Favolaschia claudopus TaxID=2862362 RepID=A0AAW0C239_9AGAR
MFSSIFSTSAPVDPNAPTFHPVTTLAKETYGELQPKDTEWLCSGGFVAETQIFYTTCDDGTFMMCQIIHSSVGVWYPTIQFTCKIYNPKTKETTWKSINVSNFVTPPPGLDKRSCKADEFSVSHKSSPGSDTPESYTVRANLAQDLQISLEVTRSKHIPGYKIGSGDKGGYSYFGHDLTKPDGYVIHRFWPRYHATGHIIRNGAASTIEGPGMFVHAIQGMRPDLVAASWNFAHFQSPSSGGVSAIQMEFTTIEKYGRKGATSGGVAVNVGSLVVGEKLAAVTAETRWPDEALSADAPVQSRASHLKPALDPETGYQVPTELLFEWTGSSLIPESPGTFAAKLHVDVGDHANPKGLVEKVDFMAEVPRVLKLAVNYVSGTKPYIYQWYNPTTLKLVGPDGKETDVEGMLYNEATWISSPQYIRHAQISPTSLHASLPRSSAFHSTPTRRGAPIIPLLALLKTSAAMELVRTAGRIVLTIMPVILFKNHKTRRHLKHAAIHGFPMSEEKTNVLLKRIRSRTLAFHLLFFIPGFLFWGTIAASLERTPLTGRWRLIILSPEEEEEIAGQLAGPGWYQAVSDILSQDGPAHLIPPSDWRYAWVRDTLRDLERTIPVLLNEGHLCKDWSEGGQGDIPLPPPAQYPLRPRPRASEFLRKFTEGYMCKRHVAPVPHSIPGPPYSLLVVDKPDASNAFSYGFGPDGGGGIVVYSGFLDEILARAPCELDKPAAAPEPQSSWLSSLFGGLFSPVTPVPPHPIPTPSQTAELAILLSHELAHLILSHHLETLSSATIIVPGVMSMISDIIRVVIFPVTMVFGPFVNDAVAQLGKVGSGELEKVGEYCTSVKQEIEADVVSARLLAHAGYDARKAVAFWENRSSSECSSNAGEQRKQYPSSSYVHNITGSKHPVSETRVTSLKGELLRWETERRAELRRRDVPPVDSNIVLATA